MRPLIVLLLALVLAGCDKEKGGEPQAAPKLAAGKVDHSRKGSDLPAIPFQAPDGAPATLTQFRGRPLIVNLWATWCAPCVAEMPMLDRLAARDKDRLHLVVVSQDMEGRRVVDPFFAKAKFTRLTPYLDKEMLLMGAMETEILPTTIFYGADGKERWRVLGALDWEGAKAKALIEEGLRPAG